MGYAIPTAVAGREVSFSIRPAHRLILQVDLLEKLLIFADAPEDHPPRLGEPGVVSVLDNVPDRTGATRETREIQRAIDQVAAAGGGRGGVLYFPAGEYRTGTLYPKSNVTLYLESGALLQGTADPADYLDHNGAAKGPLALINFDRAHDAWIKGRGVIASAGTALRARTEKHIRICNFVGCERCGIFDVILRDAAGFNVHVLQSREILLKDYKIVNDLRLSNQDGTDPDSSDGVTIDGAFMATSDIAAIAVKADVGLPERFGEELRFLDHQVGFEDRLGSAARRPEHHFSGRRRGARGPRPRALRRHRVLVHRWGELSARPLGGGGRQRQAAADHL